MTTTTTSTGSELPPQIVEAIALANARSIGGQPAVLANIALGNQIFNENLAQLHAISAQHAMATLNLAIITKGVELLSRVDPAEPQAVERIVSVVKLVESRLLPVTPARAASMEPATMGPPAAPPAAPAGGSPIPSTKLEAPSKGSDNVTGEATDPAVPKAITEGTALGEALTLGAQTAQMANVALGNLIQNLNLAQQNAVSGQQALNTLHVAVLGKLVHLLTTLGPVEAIAAEKIVSGSAAAKVTADINGPASGE